MRRGRRNMLSRVIGFAMTAVMLVTSNGVVMAAENVQPNEVVEENEETAPVPEENSTVEISSAEDLLKVADNLSANYVLTQNIDMENLGGGVR